MTVRLLLLKIIMLLSQAHGFMCFGKIELYLPLIVIFIEYSIWALLTLYGMIKNYKESKK